MRYLCISEKYLKEAMITYNRLHYHSDIVSPLIMDQSYLNSVRFIQNCYEKSEEMMKQSGLWKDSF